MKKILIPILIFVIILILYIYFSDTSNHYEKYLDGFWLASDDTFCENAGCDSCLIYFGKHDDNVRQCYIVMSPDIINSSFEMEYSIPKKFSNISKDYIFSAKIRFDDESDYEILPKNVKVNVNISTGIIKIYSEDYSILYLKCYKQHNLLI